MVLLRQVSNEETLKLLHEDNMHNIDKNFCEFQFVPRSMEELQTPAAVVAVFHDLGLMERWSINQETLSRLSIDFAAICRACWINILYRVIDCLFEKCRRFVLMVRKGYRDPPYHNWMHAFSVFHFTYVLIKRLRLVQQEYLT